jgi:hypothetical protein
MPARTGTFTGGTFLYGQELSIVHPKDNDVLSGRFFPELRNVPGLTSAQREELQREAEELLAALTLGRDYYS